MAEIEDNESAQLDRICAYVYIYGFFGIITYLCLKSAYLWNYPWGTLTGVLFVLCAFPLYCITNHLIIVRFVDKKVVLIFERLLFVTLLMLLLNHDKIV